MLLNFYSIQKASSLSEGSRVIHRNKLIGGPCSKSKRGAFATGELTETQNTFEKEKKDDVVIQVLPHHLVLHLLNQSFFKSATNQN
jgi:hypothetical protein